MDSTVVEFEKSNISGLGSEEDRNLRKQAADDEPAWKGAGQEAGIQVWRIEKFQIANWSKEDYGNFFSGDSYIILKTFLKDNSLQWNAHMWIGEKSSQDEYGTAAIKIVELDEVFDRNAVLFRETQGYESEQFLSCFQGIRILDGGIESGFNKVKPEEYKPRLIRIKGKKQFRCFEVPLATSSLNTGDVFILDNGLIIYIWKGAKCNSFENFKAASVAESIKSERRSAPKIIILEEGNESDDFWNLLGGKALINQLITSDNHLDSHRQVYRLKENENGKLTLKEMEFKLTSLDSDDVFFVYCENMVYIWIGKGGSLNEKKNAFIYVNKINEIYNKPKNTAVCVINEGKETEDFKRLFK
jgi:gelsolin